jgi:putative PIN family toxin of toxin-antitoxin system
VRIVFDTNVLVAAFRSRRGASRRWLESVLREEHVALVSVPLILEYETVLTRPEQLEASGLDVEQVGRFLDGLCSVAEPVEIMNLWRPLLRDPDDEMVLETAAFGRADLLLTFNVRDFAGAEQFGVKASRPGPAWIEAQGSKS